MELVYNLLYGEEFILIRRI